jgi:hydroxypyruvate reductase
MKQDLIVLKEMPPASVMDDLAADYNMHLLYQARDRAAMLQGVAQTCRAVTTMGGVPTRADVIDALPKLEIIACYGVGVDAIDLERAKARDIAVTNTPDVLTEGVADMALALILSTQRQIVNGDRYVRSGEWKRRGDMWLCRGVSGRKLGILGLGRIGLAIAKRAEAFGMQIAYQGPSKKPVSYRYYENLIELAREVDILVLACPGGPKTKGLVNRAVLDALGTKGTLINIARGSVVEEDELVKALVEKRLGGAGIDVFVDEPNVPEALLGLDTVTFQPHQGSATVETRRAMGQLVIDNLRNHFAGKPLLTRVV